MLGPLGTDRPHTFKLFGSYELKTKAGSTFFGLTQIAYSGTPDSTTVIYLSAPTFPKGRADLGRTPVYTQTDLGLHHSVKMGERASVKFEMNVFNLFNQAAVISRVTQINRASAISAAQLPIDRFFAGYEVNRFVTVRGSVPYNPIYGLPGASYRAGSGPVNGLLVTGIGSVGIGVESQFRRISGFPHAAPRAAVYLLGFLQTMHRGRPSGRPFFCSTRTHKRSAAQFLLNQ